MKKYYCDGESDYHLCNDATEIDNLLFETEQTQQSLEEIESLMQSEFYPGLGDEIEGEAFDSEFGGRITE